MKESKDEVKAVSVEEQVHLDARDARVKTVTEAIAAAKVAREALEKTGTMETPGAKIDREAKEEKDLAAAAKLLFIEPISVDSTIPELTKVGAKLNEVIDHINGVK